LRASLKSLVQKKHSLVQEERFDELVELTKQMSTCENRLKELGATVGQTPRPTLDASFAQNAITNAAATPAKIRRKSITDVDTTNGNKELAQYKEAEEQRKEAEVESSTFSKILDFLF